MSRRRTRSRSVLPWVAVAAVVLLCAATVLPSAAVSTLTVDRTSATDVVADPDGIHGLEVTEEVTAGETGTLVVVTNRLGTEAAVTVTLASDAASTADLVVDGRSYDTEVTSTVVDGGSLTVDVSVADDESLDGETLVFHVRSTGSGVDVRSTDRETRIVV